MKSFVVKNKNYILLVLLSSFLIWPLLMPGFFRVQDYLQAIRVYEMRQCIEDFQIPCRWVSDMGFGYGFPLFNYYGVLPYYIGAFLSYLFGFIGAVKIIFLLPLVLGGIFMYILVKEVVDGDAGLLAAVLYSFAPYRALDIYVRGAISEIFAITLMPLVLYFYLKLIKSFGRKNFFISTFVLSLFLLNHNLMTMLFVPILIIWIIYWLFVFRDNKIVKKTTIVVLISIILGLMLSSFFILPAYFEQNLIQDQNLRESDFIPNFRSHFITINQIFFSRFWGYGISTWGEHDGLSFQIGWPHWQLAFGFCLFMLLGLLLGKVKFFKKIPLLSFENTKNYILFFILFIISIVSLLMTHNKTAFLWELITKLQFLQFPWRFLSISIFSISFLAGCIVLILKKKYRFYFIVLMTILVVFLNFKYFQPDGFRYDWSDRKLLSGSEWEFYQQGSLTDFLPKNSIKPTKIAPKEPLLFGDGKVINFMKSTNKFSFQVDAKSRVVLDIPIFDFPNWEIYSNGLLVNHSDKGEFGTMKIDLDSGTHIINGYFKNTYLRKFANFISLLALGIICVIFLNRNRLFEKQ